MFILHEHEKKCINKMMHIIKNTLRYEILEYSIYHIYKEQEREP